MLRGKVADLITEIPRKSLAVFLEQLFTVKATIGRGSRARVIYVDRAEIVVGDLGLRQITLVGTDRSSGRTVRLSPNTIIELFGVQPKS